jgi:hypothetical protein
MKTGNVEEVGGRHLEERPVKELTFKGRLGYAQRRFQHAEVSQPRPPAVEPDLVSVDSQDLVEGQEERFGHSARRRNTPPYCS